MELIAETVIHLSGESARRLGELASRRGISEDALVTQALELLFRQSELPDEESEDRELLQRMEAELGPCQARITPALDPARFVVTHTTPSPPVARRPGEAR